MLFKQVLSIAKKDTLVRFSAGSELLFFLVLPILFTFVLGGGFGGPGGEEEVHPTLLLVNQEEGGLAADLVTAIEAAETVEVEQHSLAKAETLLEEKEAPALLVIPAGFNDALIDGEPVELVLRQLPNNTDALVAEQAVSAAMGEIGHIVATALRGVEEAEKGTPFASADERQAYFEELLELARSELQEQPRLVDVTVPESTVTDPDAYSVAAHQSAGQLVTWVLIPLLGTSTLFTSERTQGTLRRLLTTPLHRSTYILGTITGQLALAIIQMLLLIGFGALVMGINWGHSPLGLAIMMISFALAAVSLGTMIGAFTRTEQQAGNLSIMMGMVLALLGGCWWPRELFPETVDRVVQVLPTTWAMQGFSNLVIRGLGVQAILLEAAVLMGFAALFFVVGTARLKFE